jgi:hypothetical protein
LQAAYHRLAVGGHGLVGQGVRLEGEAGVAADAGTGFDLDLDVDRGRLAAAQDVE